MTRRPPSRSRCLPPRSLQGEALWKALGFRNVRAFQRARQRGAISVPLYPVAGTRGVYALAEHVEQWLAERQQQALVVDGRDSITDSPAPSPETTMTDP